MARLYIKDILTLGRTDQHTATDWYVYADETKQTTLFKSEKDTQHLTQISATLRNPDGSLYDVENGAYAEARVWFGNKHSPTAVLPQSTIYILYQILKKKDNI